MQSQSLTIACRTHTPKLHAGRPQMCAAQQEKQNNETNNPPIPDHDPYLYKPTRLTRTLHSAVQNPSTWPKCAAPDTSTAATDARDSQPTRRAAMRFMRLRSCLPLSNACFCHAYTSVPAQRRRPLLGSSPLTSVGGRPAHSCTPEVLATGWCGIHSYASRQDRR